MVLSSNRKYLVMATKTYVQVYLITNDSVWITFGQQIQIITTAQLSIITNIMPLSITYYGA